MAQSTVNIQKMKNVAAELEKNYTPMATNKKKLDEIMSTLPKAWHGDASVAYQRAYAENAEDFNNLAQAMKSCSTMLNGIAATYGKADMAAAEAIKAKMAKG